MSESKNCPSKFENVVDKLYTANHINSKEADNVKLQMDEFISSTAKIHQDKFLGLCLAGNQLDHFPHKYLKEISTNIYVKLWWLSSLFHMGKARSKGDSVSTKKSLSKMNEQG